MFCVLFCGWIWLNLVYELYYASFYNNIFAYFKQIYILFLVTNLDLQKGI